MRAATRKVVTDRKRAQASNAAPPSVPFLDAIKHELDDAGMLKGLPLLVLLYLASRAI